MKLRQWSWWSSRKLSRGRLEAADSARRLLTLAGTGREVGEGVGVAVDEVGRAIEVREVGVAMEEIGRVVTIGRVGVEEV